MPLLSTVTCMSTPPPANQSSTAARCSGMILYGWRFAELGVITAPRLDLSVQVEYSHIVDGTRDDDKAQGSSHMRLLVGYVLREYIWSCMIFYCLTHYES